MARKRNETYSKTGLKTLHDVLTKIPTEPVIYTIGMKVKLYDCVNLVHSEIVVTENNIAKMNAKYSTCS